MRRDDRLTEGLYTYMLQCDTFLVRREYIIDRYCPSLDPYRILSKPSLENAIRGEGYSKPIGNSRISP